MKVVLNFFTRLLSSKQDVAYQINIPVLIIVIGLLLAALGLCILISRKNRLYINNKKQKARLGSKSEVA